MSGTQANSVLRRQLSTEDLSRIAACPRCAASLAIGSARDLRCGRCDGLYPALPHGWDLRPPAELLTSDLWKTWDAVQANGSVGYREDPQRNIAVGEREDALAFARFAGLGGLVLDVGCGPQPWPAYFAFFSEDTRFVGVDPLVGAEPAEYTQLRALAEHLPFVDDAFDQVLFATTLDHFVAPERALAEATRVLKPGGTIDAWVGHKRADAPPPPESPAWYEALEQPPGAHDLFHIKRLDPLDAERLLENAGLRIVDRRGIRIDRYRSNHFFKAAVAA
jgi:SAM-dependent methyltransferase